MRMRSFDRGAFVEGIESTRLGSIERNDLKRGVIIPVKGDLVEPIFSVEPLQNPETRNPLVGRAKIPHKPGQLTPITFIHVSRLRCVENTTMHFKR